MRNRVALIGLVLTLGGCCCPEARPSCCPPDSLVEAVAPPAARVEVDYFIGDLALARLRERSQRGMDAARAAVVASIRSAVGPEAELRAWWSVLHVAASAAEQEQVGRALASLRVEAGGDNASVLETHDVAAFLKTLPVVTAMGPGTQKLIPREATLFEALYFELGLPEGAPGPGMHLRNGTLSVEASSTTQAEVAKALQRLQAQVAKR